MGPDFIIGASDARLNVGALVAEIRYLRLGIRRVTWCRRRAGALRFVMGGQRCAKLLDGVGDSRLVIGGQVVRMYGSRAS